MLKAILLIILIACICTMTGVTGPDTGGGCLFIIGAILLLLILIL